MQSTDSPQPTGLEGTVRLVGADGDAVAALLDRLRAEDALGQLLERRDRMAQLATEAGDVKLDWVDGVAWALDHPEALEQLERQVAELPARGIRHLIWAGMGGSVQTVHVLKRLGMLDHPWLTVHPLDSTDPAALNHLLQRISGAEGLDVTEAGLATALERTLMIGVSMGMTSEEPITHLAWFDELLREHGVDSAQHLLVMTLPDSFLEQAARERGQGAAPMIPLQPSGESHTPGRMSAPSTNVFLLPATIALMEGTPDGDGAAVLPGALRQVLERCQAEYRLRPGLSPQERAAVTGEGPFIRLGAWLTAQAAEGRNKILLVLTPAYRGLAMWIEQLVEESLGKGGKGLLVFYDEDLTAAADWPDDYTVVQLVEDTEAPDPTQAAVDALAAAGRPVAQLRVPPAATLDSINRLGVLARLFAGWNVTVAIFGYLNEITFAGQPAVEGYKRYARELREAPGDLPYPDSELTRLSPEGSVAVLTLYHGALPAAGLSEEDLAAAARNLGGTDGLDEPAAVLAAAIALLRDQGRLGYFDVTLNAEPYGPLWDLLYSYVRRFANQILRCPVKIRSGPRDYHSTEQSEVDGPPEVLSLRLLIRNPETMLAGEYSPRFLHAQALGTMLAMRDAGRPILLGTLETTNDGPAVVALLTQTAQLLEGRELATEDVRAPAPV
jgi:hypothetical protein